MDGIDMWKSLSENMQSPRNLMLHNIDESRNIAALRVGDWKMVKGNFHRVFCCFWTPVVISNGPSKISD